MYRETYKSKTFGFLFILAAITAAFCLLSLPSWLGWTSFAWIYELAVLIALAFTVATLLRHRSYEYTYVINEGIVSVSLRVGMKEQVLCAFEVDSIVATEQSLPVKELKARYDVYLINRCTGELFGSEGTQIVFENRELNRKEVLVFCPSDRFTEILRAQLERKATEVPLT